MRDSDAGIAQLVEHDLAKVGVASSSLVSRSRFGGLKHRNPHKKATLVVAFFMAERKGARSM